MANEAETDGETEAPRPGPETVTTNNSAARDTAAAPGEGSETSDAAPENESSRNRGAERRISKLTRARRAAEAEAQRLRQENDALHANLQKALEGSPAPVKPKLSDFEGNEDGYADALVAWRDATARRAAALSTPRPSARQQGPSDEAKAAFFEEGRAELGDDFVQAQQLASQHRFPLTPTMGEVLIDSDVGPLMFVELSQQPELAAKIAGMTPVLQGAAMRDLEIALSKRGAESSGGNDASNEPDSPAPPAPQRGADGKFQRRGAGKTRAPPPGPEAGGSGGAPSNLLETKGSKVMRHGDLDDFMRRRREYDRKRRR